MKSWNLKILEDNANHMVDMSMEIAWDIEDMFGNNRKEKSNPLVICDMFLLPL